MMFVYIMSLILKTKNADMCKLSVHGTALWHPVSLWTSNTSMFPSILQPHPFSILPSVFSLLLCIILCELSYIVKYFPTKEKKMKLC